MPIKIEDLRKQVERNYVGFSPSTTGVKPVHIANGMFRTILDKTAQTDLLFRFVISQSKKGEIPAGHKLDEVYAELSSHRRLDADSVSADDIARLRILVEKALCADSAVYAEKGMESYTAGFEGFVSKDRIAQDGGELIAAWLKRRKSPLLKCLATSLSDSGDVLSTLSLPLLSNELFEYSSDTFDFDKIPFLVQPLPARMKRLWNGLTDAASTLSLHLENHPNKLFRFRLAILFASFVLIRHLSCLEACYVPDAQDRIPPLLLDFAGGGVNPIARASLMTYTHVGQSIARFYAWAFGETLRGDFNIAELRRESPPEYRQNSTPEMIEVWNLAQQEVKQNRQAYSVFGQAIYDMMAMKANASPIEYLRKLGQLSGLLYPPNEKSQRFALQQDTLEMLLRGAIPPGTTVTMSELQEKLWERYGIIVGGRSEDERALIDAGIYQADSDALKANLNSFSDELSQMNFARLLADGVLQVEAEAANVA